jgi:hypothetical protein
MVLVQMQKQFWWLRHVRSGGPGPTRRRYGYGVQTGRSALPNEISIFFITALLSINAKTAA